MGSFTEVLVYIGWAAAPLVAYQGLMHGLRRDGPGFAVILCLYAGAVAITSMTLRAEHARDGFGAISPQAILIPLIGTALLSGALFWLGWTTDKGHD